MRNQFVEDIICKKRDKICAVILSVKDKECNNLTPESSRALRKVILDQINDFADLACDLLEAVETDDVINELVLEVRSLSEKVG